MNGYHNLHKAKCIWEKICNERRTLESARARRYAEYKRQVYTETRYTETRHTVTRHTQTETRHICQFCSERFFDQQGLYSHILVHEEYKPYICGFCKAGYRVSSTLKGAYMMIFDSNYGIIMPLGDILVSACPYVCVCVFMLEISS